MNLEAAVTDTPYTPEDLPEAETPDDTSKPSEKRKDELLESDLENTFPASDPVTPKHIT